MQLFENALTLLFLAFGGYCLGYAVGLFKRHPAQALALMTRAVVKGAFKLVTLLVAGTIEFAGTLYRGAPGPSATDVHGGAAFLSGWARRRLLSPRKAGPCIDGRNAIVPTLGYKNIFICAPSGAGKSTIYTLVNLLRRRAARGSLIVTDPAGEAHRLTAGYLDSLGYDIKVLDLGSRHSLKYNPLERVTTAPEAEKLARILVSSAFPSTSSDGRFWEQGAQGIIGLLIRFLKQEPKEYQNLANVRHLLLAFGTSGERLNNFVVRNTTSPRDFEEWKGLLSNNERVLSSFLSTAKTALQPYSDPALCAVTSSESLNFETLRSRPGVFYLVIPETQIKYYSFICSALFTQLFEWALIQPAPDDQDLQIILDEFPAMGRIPDFEVTICCTRKRKISISLLCQSTTQLNAIYGLAGATIVDGGCSNRLFLPGLPLQTCQEIERTLGKRTIKIDERREIGRPLMTAAEIRQLPSDRAIFISGSSPPVLVRTRPFYRSRTLLARSRIPAPSVPTYDSEPVKYLDL